MFNENSGLVKVWVRLIRDKKSTYTQDDVPNISNLRSIVDGVLQQLGDY